MVTHATVRQELVWTCGKDVPRATTVESILLYP